MLAGVSIGRSGNPQRARMGCHMETICQKRHRSRDIACGNLTDHHHHGEHHYPQCSFGIVIVGGAQEVVAMFEISRAHGLLTLNTAESASNGSSTSCARSRPVRPIPSWLPFSVQQEWHSTRS
ncbi:hypothetical protein D3C80_1680160 [compost metagenome]